MSCTRRSRWGLAVVFLLLGSTVVAAEEHSAARFFDLTRGGKPSATMVAPDDKGPVWDDAVAMIASTAKRWGGVAPKVVRLAKEAPLPDGDLIVLGTKDTSDTLAQRSRQTKSPISRVAFADAHAFAVEARTESNSKRLLIAGKTARGAYNGAVFCRDFLLDAPSGEPGKADVFVRSADVVRSPRLGARGTYHLSLY